MQVSSNRCHHNIDNTPVKRIAGKTLSKIEQNSNTAAVILNSHLHALPPFSKQPFHSSHISDVEYHGLAGMFSFYTT
jgi:hypothetical protein